LTLDLPYEDKYINVSNEKHVRTVRDYYRTRLYNKEGCRFYVRLEPIQRGGQKAGKHQRIKEIFIGQDNFLYVGFNLANAEAGDNFRYVKFAKIVPILEEQDQEQEKGVPTLTR
jgi:hypothetical protein